MEDLHVHEVQQGMKVSKESSAATLGAMLPTVPPDKTIIKKEGIETMIPEELMEFIYNEDASYTYAVEGAISNMAHNVKDKFTNNDHSKDLKTNSLPFKVRQLTIERATLKVKISWMGKRKSKQEKVLKYKKRLVEVEQALRKIQNSVNNADEKKKIAQQIKELDASVTKSASAELQQRGVLESVNAFICEGKEQGFILSDVQEFTMESFYGDLGDTEFNVVTEGANSKMYFTTQNAKKKVKTLSKKAKKAIKHEKYDDAAGYIEEIQKEIDEAKKELKSYPQDDIDKNFIGMLVGWCMFTLKCLLQSIGVGVVGSAAAVAGASIATISTVTSITSTGANILNIYHVVEQISANLKKNNGDAKTSLINGLYNRCLVSMDKMSKQTKELSKAVKSAKKATEKEDEKETKESVLPRLTELNDLYESGCIDTDSYLELMTEAKKPDEGMIPILNKLHDKGYKTKYSCTGHKDSGKKDRNDDGIVNGKLASAGRIMFNGDYDFPDPPKHWGFKTVEGKDYLYVLPYSNDGKDPKAFEDWKNKYMTSLDRWVDSLPTAKDEKVIDKPEEDKKDKEADVKEYVEDDSVFDSFVDNTLAELFMDVNNDF